MNLIKIHNRNAKKKPIGALSMGLWNHIGDDSMSIDNAKHLLSKEMTNPIKRALLAVEFIAKETGKTNAEVIELWKGK